MNENQSVLTAMESLYVTFRRQPLKKTNNLIVGGVGRVKNVHDNQ